MYSAPMPRSLTRGEGDFCEHCQMPGREIGILAYGIKYVFCHDHAKCWLCPAHIEEEIRISKASSAKRPPG